MKTTLAVFFSAVLALLVGCSTLPTPQSGQTLATLAGLAVEPVLANNPSYIPVAQAVADELESLSTGTLDAAGVAAFAAQIATRHGMEATDAQFALVILQTLLASYTDQTGAVTIDLGTARPYIHAFAGGLRSAILIASGSARSGPPDPAAARYAKLYAEGAR